MENQLDKIDKTTMLHYPVTIPHELQSFLAISQRQQASIDKEKIKHTALWKIIRFKLKAS